jgi:hypothetical protein
MEDVKDVIKDAEMKVIWQKEAVGKAGRFRKIVEQSQTETVGTLEQVIDGNSYVVGSVSLQRTSPKQKQDCIIWLYGAVQLIQDKLAAIKKPSQAEINAVLNKFRDYGYAATSRGDSESTLIKKAMKTAKEALSSGSISEAEKAVLVRFGFLKL